jgi:hypothetical protein
MFTHKLSDDLARKRNIALLPKPSVPSLDLFIVGQKNFSVYLLPCAIDIALERRFDLRAGLSDLNCLFARSDLLAPLGLYG